MKKINHRVSRLAMLAAAAAFAAAPLAPLSVLAAEVSNTNIVVSNASAGSYNLYQLFTGDYASTGTGADEKPTFGNIQVNPAYKNAILTAIQAYNPDFKLTVTSTEDNQANQMAEAIAALSDTQGFANTLAGLLKETAATESKTSENSTVSLPVTQTGYYLVASDTGNKTITSGILVPVTAAGDMQVTLKASEPTVTKQVAYSGTADFGEYTQAGLVNGKVQSPVYRIIGTLNKNLFDYPEYKYAIKDALPAGMTIANGQDMSGWNIKVTAYKNPEDTAGTTLNPEMKVDSTSITWTFADLKEQLTGWTNADAETGYVEITYSPVYDADDISAIYGQQSTLAAPQINTVDITYSNNPYSQTDLDPSTNVTAADTAKVYSFNLNLRKVTLDDTALKGAAFTLTDAKGNPIGNEITAADNGVFVWTGLEAGKEYTLTETKVPAGYRKIDPVTFTLTMTEGNEKLTVESITVTEVSDPSGAAVWGSDKDKGAGGATFTSATADVYIGNTAGPNMPSTGQSGIVIATAAGLSILTLSAAAILKKKKESQN